MFIRRQTLRRPPKIKTKAFRRQTLFEALRARRQHQNKPRKIYISSTDSFPSSTSTLESKQILIILHSVGRRFSTRLETDTTEA